MLRGTIKRIVADRGFGFIKPAVRGPDVFFHLSALPQQDDFAELEEGQSVAYELDESHERARAKRVLL